MSDPAAEPDDLTARRIATSLAWTKEENWDGDKWIGQTMPPWGSKPRCPAIRNGRQCRKPVIPGGAVCNTHGGAAPQVKRRAKLRVLQLLDPALGQLARILANPDDQRIGLAAIKMVTDLNGMTGKSDVDSTLAKSILMDRHFALQAQARKQMEEAVAEELEGEIEEPEYADEVPAEPAETGSQDVETRSQQEIDDDDELLYNPAASQQFEQKLDEDSDELSNALSSDFDPNQDDDDDFDPLDPGPDEIPVTRIHPPQKSLESGTLNLSSDLPPLLDESETDGPL